MPVSFLTEQQRNRYGRFVGELSPEQLSRYFHLHDRDRRLVNSHRGDHSRLGFAIQLCTARFLGTFLEDLSDVPDSVVNCLARQLQIEQLSSFFYYRESETRWDHAMEVRRHCGFRDFGDLGAQFRLNRWLYALCWTGTDRPGVLFDRATTWLIAQKVLLPAVTTLERHVPRLRSRIEERVRKILTAAASLETDLNLNPYCWSLTAGTNRYSTGCAKTHIAGALPNSYERWIVSKKSGTLLDDSPVVLQL
jgi:hypothetical protein